ncbi:carboxypeptidase regulatory-like domain-containing protein [Planctomycetota bacterium]|nr:carboxypeptidase regulatory-like domain-containing protein [Planctomycetota bacterium]
MKAPTFLALVFGVIVGVAGTFMGLHTIGALDAGDNSPRVAKQQADSTDEPIDNTTVEIKTPVILDDTEDADDADEPGKAKTVNKPSDPESTNSPLEAAPAKPDNPTAESGNTHPGQPTDEEKLDAIQDALKNALEGLDGLEGLGGEIPDAETLEGILGGPKVDLNASISGTVVDTNGVPIANARIYADFMEEASAGGAMSLAISRTSGDDDGNVIATTDGAGNWQADVSRKIAEKAKLRVSLVAKSDGYAESEVKSVHVKNGDTKEGVKLTLRGAGSLVGYVRDERGGGVEGVAVTLQKGASSFGGGTFVMMGGSGKLSARTDSSGFYRIEEIPEGSYSFSLKADGIREVSGPKRVEIKVGVENTAPAEFVVAQTTALKLTLVNEDGTPVRSFVTVKVEDENGNAVKTLNGMTDENGTITLNDPPAGTHNVKVTTYSYEPLTIFCDFREGQVYDAGTLTVKLSEVKKGLPGRIIIPD